MTEYSNLIDEALKEYESKNFAEKIWFCGSIPLFENMDSYNAGKIKYDGFVDARDNFCITGTGGKCHVYLWKHLLTGKVFYVGSGTKDRWTQKYRKNTEFLRHLDYGDAVVYKVADELDRDTAYLYEKYISYSFGIANCELSNRDNNVNTVGIETAKQWVMENQDVFSGKFAKAIEYTILNNILDDRSCESNMVIAICKFRELYGSHYFSTSIGLNK